MTFLRGVLCLRRNVTGIRLIRPKKVIAMQACKLHIINLKAQTRIARLIRINKEAIMIKHSREKQIIDYNRRTKNQTVQIEEVYQIMKERKLEVVNQTIEMPFLMDNKTIIEYIEQYMKENDLDNVIFD